MSIIVKYRVCQAAAVASIIAGLLCLNQMSPWLSPHHNTFWFWLVVLDVIIGIPFAVGYYYFRAKLRDADLGLTEVKTLAAGAKYLDGRKGNRRR